MTSVHTGSRLHFGLFDLKHFGGIGMMIDEPRVEAIAERAENWSISGPMPARTKFVIDRLVKHVPELPPMRVGLAQVSPEHAGFGCGTQSSLALATAIVSEANCDVSTVALAQMLDRGHRSAIGIHGFTNGGLLMDAGTQHNQSLSPLAERIELPSDWLVLLITPNEGESWSGRRERDAFAILDQHANNCDRFALRQFAESTLLPPARAGDLVGFGAALTEYNAKAGELFAPVQGGRYASATVTNIVNELIARGLTGVGQSSWGPTVFAFGTDKKELESVGHSATASGANEQVARPRNIGAETKRCE